MRQKRLLDCKFIAAPGQDAFKNACPNENEFLSSSFSPTIFQTLSVCAPQYHRYIPKSFSPTMHSSPPGKDDHSDSFSRSSRNSRSPPSPPPILGALPLLSSLDTRERVLSILDQALEVLAGTNEDLFASMDFPSSSSLVSSATGSVCSWTTEDDDKSPMSAKNRSSSAPPKQ